MLTDCTHNDGSGGDKLRTSELPKRKQEYTDDIKSIKLDNNTVSGDFGLEPEPCCLFWYDATENKEVYGLVDCETEE